MRRGLLGEGRRGAVRGRGEARERVARGAVRWTGVYVPECVDVSACPQADNGGDMRTCPQGRTETQATQPGRPPRQHCMYTTTGRSSARCPAPRRRTDPGSQGDQPGIARRDRPTAPPSSTRPNRGTGRYAMPCNLDTASGLGLPPRRNDPRRKVARAGSEPKSPGSAVGTTNTGTAREPQCMSSRNGAPRARPAPPMPAGRSPDLALSHRCGPPKFAVARQAPALTLTHNSG